ncbi:MAG: YdcF family protein [Merismopedia sp. SIO2A8]|nr:YdcF family protein [Symploca sp. SIO2B6]NET47544.1 YdcF family protein [Merismopedia sp. SIO2A8]
MMWIAFTAALLLCVLSYIPLRLTTAYLYHPQPDTILTLGGGTEREAFTAQFAQSHPNLDIWVSTGIAPQEAQLIFQSAGIPDHRIHLDRRAIDTVTNFTSLVQDFKARSVHHVYLITSDFHMRRSTTIAFFVLGSQGIAYTPVAIPSNQSEESLLRVARDAGRSLLWLATGRTGARFHPLLRT